MPKNIFCAKCGMELFIFRKAVQGNIFDLVSPHKCEDLQEPTLTNELVPIPQERPSTGKLTNAFNSQKFVQSLNELNKSIGDKRSNEDIRKEKPTDITSTAPITLNILRGIVE